MAAGPLQIGTACPRCGAASAPDARFCAGCGSELAAATGTPDGTAQVRESPIDAVTPPRPPPVSPAPPPPGGQPPMPPAPPGPVAMAALPAPPFAAPAPAAVPAPGVVLATSPFPGIEPSSVGRRASPLGWAGVVIGAAVFLVAALAVVAAAGVPTPGGAGTAPGGAGATAGAPLARFDETLYDGGTVSEGVPWEIEVEAVNPASAPTDPLWMVVDWAPDGDAGGSGVRGRLVACEPDSCDGREDGAGRRTIVSWPGLPAGGRQVLRATVVATGLEPGVPLAYRVTTGSGPGETTMDGGNIWDLELDTE